MSASDIQEVAKKRKEKEAEAYDLPSALTKHVSYRGETDPLPLYDSLEMGVHNSGFVADTNSNRASTIMQMRAFSPYAVDTPTSGGEEPETASRAPDDHYLVPMDGSAGHQYEDLAQMAAKLAANKPTTGGPRKKANVLYEPAEMNNGKPSLVYARAPEPTKYTPHSSGGDKKILLLFLFVGIIAVISLVIAILATQGVLSKRIDCSCTSSEALKSTGVDTRVDFLMKKVQELETNLTTLRQQMGLQDIKELKMKSSEQSASIAAIDTRLTAEESSTTKLNDTVASLKRRQGRTEDSIGNLNNTVIYTRRSLETLLDQRVALLQLTSYALKKNLTVLGQRVDSDFKFHDNARKSLLSELQLSNSSINAKVLELKQQLISLGTTLNGKVTSVEQDLNLTIYANTAKLHLRDNQLAALTQQLNESLSMQLMNISLTPGPEGPIGPTGVQGPIGPQGPRGAGNLTACRSTEVLETSAPFSSGDAARATASARASAGQGYVIVGGACSSPNALRTLLEQRSAEVYQCRCDELSPGTGGQVECRMRIWECPAS